MIPAASSSQRAVAQAVVQDVEERARRAKPPGLEQLCRYLLVADTYSVLVRARPAPVLPPRLSASSSVECMMVPAPSCCSHLCSLKRSFCAEIVVPTASWVALVMLTECEHVCICRRRDVKG